jgi:hypothetical protein
VRRRDLLCSIAGVTIIWGGPVIAQPADQVRRVGIFHAYEEADPEERAQISAFRDELSKLGWVEGRNVVVDLKCPLPLLREYFDQPTRIPREP